LLFAADAGISKCSPFPTRRGERARRFTRHVNAFGCYVVLERIERAVSGRHVEELPAEIVTPP
jgi:hypothetical protein